MWRDSFGCGSSCSIWTGSSAPVRMCRLAFVMAIVTMNIHVSSQIPPKLPSCRNTYKAREAEDYVFEEYRKYYSIC